MKILLRFQSHGVVPRMWKRDVEKAFRRLLIAKDHHQFAVGVFHFQGLLWKLQHYGNPFGAVSANHNWHRVGSFVRFIIRRRFKAPCARFVDDFFGACRDGVQLAGGVLTSRICELLGLDCDESKSVDGALRMTVLGACVASDFVAKQVTSRVDEAKSIKWCKLLEKVLRDGMISRHNAEKMAGRLQAAVSMSLDKTGRAFVKPFYAQANKPTRRNTLWLSTATEWWLKYLQIRPPSFMTVAGDRPTQFIYSDAAGDSHQIAAVLMHRVNGVWRYKWTAMKVPDAIWDQLLDRGDCQIGYQEFLAVVLGYSTFRRKSAMSIGFIDNDGVLGALMKGSANHPEVNTGIGMLWLDFAVDDVSFFGARVESKANISDEPSRDKFDTLARLGAEYVPPRLPSWAWNLWQWPA